MCPILTLKPKELLGQPNTSSLGELMIFQGYRFLYKQLCSLRFISSNKSVFASFDFFWALHPNGKPLSLNTFTKTSLSDTSLHSYNPYVHTDVSYIFTKNVTVSFL